MNECTLRDVIIYSSDFSRIDHINDQRILGNRLIHHKLMNEGNYLLIDFVRKFAEVKKLEEISVKDVQEFTSNWMKERFK